MTKETIKTECGLTAVNYFLADHTKSWETVVDFKTQEIDVDLLHIINIPHYVLAIWNKTECKFQEATIIDGTEAEAIEEFETVCNRFKTEPTNWGWKGKA